MYCHPVFKQDILSLDVTSLIPPPSLFLSPPLPTPPSLSSLALLPSHILLLFHLSTSINSKHNLVKLYRNTDLLGCYFIAAAAAAAAKSLQSSLTLCDPIDGCPPGSPIPGILQGRTLEWVAISFSTAWKWKVKVKSLSRVQLLATPWTAAYQAPPSVGFSRQEYWSGVPLPSPYFIARSMLISSSREDL